MNNRCEIFWKCYVLSLLKWFILNNLNCSPHAWFFSHFWHGDLHIRVAQRKRDWGLCLGAYVDEFTCRSSHRPRPFLVLVSPPAAAAPPPHAECLIGKWRQAVCCHWRLPRWRPSWRGRWANGLTWWRAGSTVGSYWTTMQGCSPTTRWVLERRRFELLAGRSPWVAGDRAFWLRLLGWGCRRTRGFPRKGGF